jgi:hypothetical protein
MRTITPRGLTSRVNVTSVAPAVSPGTGREPDQHDEAEAEAGA